MFNRTDKLTGPIKWPPRGGEILIEDDMCEIDEIRGPITGEGDPLLDHPMTAYLIAAMIDGRETGDFDAAIATRLQEYNDSLSSSES